MRTSRVVRLAAVAALVTLGACSGGDGGGASEDAGREAVAPGGPVVGEPGGGEGAAPDRGGADQVSIPALESPDLVKTAEVTIIEDDLAAARERVDELLRKHGAVVADEDTVNNAEGEPSTSTLVVRVPTRSFRDMLDDLTEQLDVRSSTARTEDVHQQVIDVESRLANLRVSLERLRRFLRDASDLNAMLQFEQRITSVETQIASLMAQRQYLADQTSMSTVTLEMRTPDAPPPDDDPLEGAGFLTGLKNGWDALRDVLLVIATVLGAVVPFAVAAAVVGVPLWLVLRRRRQPVAAPE